jgi:TM2 domain-containing membrane protein YozV
VKTCERCGNKIAENATICLVCGTVRGLPQASRQPVTNYGQYPQSSLGESPSSTQGQTPPYTLYTQPQTYQELSREIFVGYNPHYSYGAQQPPPRNGYALPPTDASMPMDKTDSALVAEILLSLFGIFGIGWLMAGETAIGVILLLASILFYWPVILLGAVVTEGFGLICLGPLAIGAIILNIVLLSSVLRHKAAKQPYRRRPFKEQ